MDHHTTFSSSDRHQVIEKQSRMTIAARILSNETLLVAVTLILSLGTVVALAVFLRFDGWGLSLFRIMVITIFTILPAVMYYVFIASRKQSLFQEFVSNLGRLGLLQADDKNSLTEDDRKSSYFKRTRILSYIDRFEAVYGPVGTQSKCDLLEATHCGATPDREQEKTAIRRGKIFSPATAVPVFLATFLVGLGWIQFIPPLLGGELLELEIIENPRKPTLHADLLYEELPALFAFLGAYFFSLQMLYRRYVTNDLRASAFISVSIRVVLAVIGALLLQVIFQADMISFNNETYWLLFMSFVVGVFPPVLWQIVRDVSGRLLRLGKFVPSLDSDLPLNKLDGLTIWHATRLEEEDIDNAHNMANADIIALLVNTKMPPERIIDWVDQAILYTCVGAPGNTAIHEQADLPTRLAQQGISKASALNTAVVNAHERDLHSGSTLADLHGLQVQSVIEGIKSFCNIALINHWRANSPGGSVHYPSDQSLSLPEVHTLSREASRPAVEVRMESL